MKIREKTYFQIMEAYSSVPPECGGIIGSQNGIVTAYYHDFGSDSQNSAVYIPNIDILNEKIQIWRSQNIQFCGMVHSHLSNETKLSESDKVYIADILGVNSDFCEKMYFPIVIPKQRMISFLAKKEGNKISIMADTIEFV